MKLLTLSPGAVFALSTLLGGCGSGAAAPDDAASVTFPVSPLSAVMTDTGKLHVDVHTAPYQPLVAGVDSVELVVTDAATGASVDGLSIAMTPWMPAMGHGASVTPLLTAMGDGRYVFTNVSLFMPGEWQLRISFSGKVEDSVEPTFNVD